MFQLISANLPLVHLLFQSHISFYCSLFLVASGQLGSLWSRQWMFSIKKVIPFTYYTFIAQHNFMCTWNQLSWKNMNYLKKILKASSGGMLNPKFIKFYNSLRSFVNHTVFPTPLSLLIIYYNIFLFSTILNHELTVVQTKPFILFHYKSPNNI